MDVLAGIGLQTFDDRIQAPSDVGLPMARFSARNGNLLDAALGFQGETPSLESNQTRVLPFGPTIVFVGDTIGHISYEARKPLWSHMGLADDLASEPVVAR